MIWSKVAAGLFASHPTDIEGTIRLVNGLDQVVALMREPPGEPAIIVTNMAGGSAVSTITRRASAIVSTIGGPNSHIVVVARDHKIPCIVGAGGLDIAGLENGMRARLRSNGDIELLNGQAPAPRHMRVLRNIVFAGAAAELGQISGVGDGAAAVLADLAAQGLVDTDGVIAPTKAGLDALEGWYEGDRAGLDASLRAAIIEHFRPLDRALKQIASDWQEAEAGEDWDGKLKAVEDLAGLHAETLAFLERFAPQLPRFDEYGVRLTRACEQVLDGETGYFVGVDVDSYHTIWFNLHEDLLRLLQRERDPE